MLLQKNSAGVNKIATARSFKKAFTHMVIPGYVSEEYMIYKKILIGTL